MGKPDNDQELRKLIDWSLKQQKIEGHLSHDERVELLVTNINAHTQKLEKEWYYKGMTDGRSAREAELILSHKPELQGKLEVWKYIQKQFKNSDGYFEIGADKVHSFIELIEMQLTTEDKKL